MKKITAYWKKNWHVCVLVLVMLLSLGIRAWNIEDSLYFRMDQARDAQLIKAAMDGGIGELPLLGPRAAGSFLRLGPVFYYFQFISAKTFNSIEPYVLAFPDLLFSILAIPLFFYFLRQFFSKKVSIAVTIVFASSFLLTQYARFAWNPNSIPFWFLLTILGAYKTVTEKSSKKAGKWLLVMAFGYAIASQLHFTALLSLPVVVFIFWLFGWPKKIKFKFWVLALAVLAFFYIPMAISETFTEFDNSHQFLYALSTKGSDEVSLRTQLDRSLHLHAKYYSLALTSYGNHHSMFFVGALLFMIIFTAWRFKVLWKKEKWKKKKSFIILIIVWFLVFALLYSKLAMDISKPRFWLLIVFLPFIFLGTSLQWMESFKQKNLAKLFAVVLCGLLITTNLYAVGYWYYSLKTQQPTAGFYTRDLVLKQSDLIGVRQMRTVAGDWVEISQKNKKQICYTAERSYLSPYEYILDTYYPMQESKRIKYSKDTNNSCSFVSVRHGATEGKNPVKKSHAAEFDVVSKKLYNRMVVWELTQNGTFMEEEPKEELVEEAPVQEVVEEVEENLEKPEKLPRKPRVFWKHVFGWEKYEG